MTNLADVQIPITVAAPVLAAGVGLSWKLFRDARAMVQQESRTAVHIHENTYHGEKHEI